MKIEKQPTANALIQPVNKSDYKAHAAILLANVLFGLNFIFAKNVDSKYISPEAFSMLRITVGCLLFWVIAPFCPRNKLTRNDYIRLFFAGFFGSTVNMYAFLKGIVYTTPVDASIIMTLVPLTVLLLSALFLREHITFLKMAGIVLGAAGAAVLISYSGKVSMGGNNLTGNLMCLGCVLSYSIYLVIIKPIVGRLHPFTVMRWVFLFSIIQSAPLFGKSLINVDWGVMPSNTLLSITYVVIAATFLTYLLTSMALQHLRASIVSMYSYVQPVVATFIAIIIGQDSFNVVKLLAAGLVFAGVYLVIRPKKSVN